MFCGLLWISIICIGKNIVALSKVPKVRDSNWALGSTGLLDDLNTKTIVNENNNNKTASASNEAAIVSAVCPNNDYTTHTSPFSFGFQLM